MALTQQLLKYQQADGKLLKIERETAGSEERKNYAQTANFLNKASERLDYLEAKAVELSSLIEKLNKKYDEIAEILHDFEHLDELIGEGADITFYKKNATQINDRIRSIKNETAQLEKAIKEADEEYKNLKKKTIATQKQHAENTEIYKKYRESKQAEMNAVKAELEKLKEGIAPDFMKRYESKRSERIFPILCPVKSGRCGICGSELSIAAKDKVLSGTLVECDNCHRILYNE